MNKKIMLVVPIIVALLTACTSIVKDIRVDAIKDPKANFSGYKTYAWVGAAEILNDPELQWHSPKVQVVDEIKFLIDRELQRRDISMASLGNADLGVAFFIGTDMAAMKLKKDPNANVELLENVPESGLVVALIDAKTGYVIWLGVAVADYKADQYTAKEIRERLDYAIFEMFELYKFKLF